MSDASRMTVTAGPGEPADADACFARLVTVLNSGMLALMISVGERVGLFDTMRSLPAATSAQVATAAGLDERYVREWLAALTAGGIVIHDPAAGTFELPPAYGEALSRGLGRPESIAGMCQHVAMLGKVEDRITEHFRQGGGVPYDTYEQLWGTAESYDLDAVDPMAVDHVLSLLPGIGERLGAGIDVADVGCGGVPSSISSPGGIRPAGSSASNLPKRPRCEPRDWWPSVTGCAMCDFSRTTQPLSMEQRSST